ncbi:MAG: helix-turn-helix transcriptional regulator [Victivallales bacterium]
MSSSVFRRKRTPDSSDTTYCCRAGTVIIVPPRTVHCTIADSAVERWCIHFDWYGNCRAHREKERIWVFLDEEESFEPELAAAPPAESFGIVFPFHNTLHEKERSILLNLLERFFNTVPDTLPDLLRRRGLFLEILALALKREKQQVFPVNEKLNPRFFQAKSIMDASFQNPRLTIRLVAERLRITPNHLTKLFRHEMGMSALDYVQNLRLRHAAELLRENSLNIQEIALESGFEDPNYFTRLFRQRHGMTPTRFRRISQTAEI